MIKVFTTNKNGKIELTKEELKELLDEAYWDGYKANNQLYYTYTTSTWTPYSTTCKDNTTSIALNTDNIKDGTITCDPSLQINLE